MSAENKFGANRASALSTIDYYKSVQIGVVVSIDDPESLGRIKVRITGKSNRGGDDGVAIANIPWAYPMMPKFFSVTPNVGEGVFVLIHDKQKTNSDRLYFGPIITQLNNLDHDPISSTALNAFSFATSLPRTNFDRIPALKGVFGKPEDIVIQGRYNTDLIFKRNEILIRAGKFVDTSPTTNNPFSFEFNTSTPAYIQIKNAVPINNTEQIEIGSVTNIVANKINLLTHKDGSPRFNLANQDDQLSNSEIIKILETAHPIGFGDVQLEYLKLLKNALLSHVHSSNGTPATDIVIGGATQDVLKLKTHAEDLEKRMLSNNIRIN